MKSRGEAAEAISSGRILVGGAVAENAARRVEAGDALSVQAAATRFASRGGDKLAGALRALGVDASGCRVLDAGASTGGFTDCLLQHGASHVYAVDVGHGQLAWSLRTDPRVTVLDRTNVRTLDPDAIDGPVPLAVADLSFISLRTVAPALARCTTPDATLVLLVKPQFEAGRARVGKRGIVRDPEVHAAVLEEVAEALAADGLHVRDVTPSPVLGARGNREFFFRCDRTGPALTAHELRAVADAAPTGVS